MILPNFNIATAHLWINFSLEKSPGLYLYEIENCQEIDKISYILNAIFEQNNGYFIDLLKQTEEIDFIEGKFDFKTAEDFSKNFELGGKINTNLLKYEIEKINSNWKIIPYIKYDSESDNIEKLYDIGQITAKLVSSLLISPFLGRYLNKNLIGIVFRHNEVDVFNSQILFDYFIKIIKESNFNDTKIILFLITENLGRDDNYYKSEIERVGFIRKLTFFKTYSFSACKSRIIPISAGLSKYKTFVLFCGAGASASIKTETHEDLPLGDELKKIAIKNVLQNSELQEENLEEEFKKWLEKSQHLIRENGETRDNVVITLERVLMEELRDISPTTSKTLDYLKNKCESCQSSLGYINIRKIIELNYHPLIITTNYDTLFNKFIENAIEYSVNEDYKEKENKIISYLQGVSKEIPILKIHGSLTNPRSIKESVNHTYQLPLDINSLLSSIYSGKINSILGDIEIPTFFVGYSFRDEDIRNFYSNPNIFKKLKPFNVNPSPNIEAIEFFAKLGHKPEDVNLNIPFSYFSAILLDQLCRNKG